MTTCIGPWRYRFAWLPTYIGPYRIWLRRYAVRMLDVKTGVWAQDSDNPLPWLARRMEYSHPDHGEFYRVETLFGKAPIWVKGRWHRSFRRVDGGISHKPRGSSLA